MFVFTRRYDDSRWYFLMPLLFTVLVPVSMVKKPGWDVPDTKVTRLPGTAGMLLYMNHSGVLYALEAAAPQWSLRHKLAIAAAISCAFMAVSYFGGEALKKHLRIFENK